MKLFYSLLLVNFSIFSMQENFALRKHVRVEFDGGEGPSQQKKARATLLIKRFFLSASALLIKTFGHRVFKI